MNLTIDNQLVTLNVLRPAWQEPLTVSLGDNAMIHDNCLLIARSEKGITLEVFGISGGLTYDDKEKKGFRWCKVGCLSK